MSACSEDPGAGELVVSEHARLFGSAGALLAAISLGFHLSANDLLSFDHLLASGYNGLIMTFCGPLWFLMVPVVGVFVVRSVYLGSPVVLPALNLLALQTINTATSQEGSFTWGVFLAVSGTVLTDFVLVRECWMNRIQK